MSALAGLYPPYTTNVTLGAYGKVANRRATSYVLTAVFFVAVTAPLPALAVAMKNVTSINALLQVIVSCRRSWMYLVRVKIIYLVMVRRIYSLRVRRIYLVMIRVMYPS